MRRRRGGDLRRGLLYDPRVGGMGNTARGAGSFLSDHPKFECGGDRHGQRMATGHVEIPPSVSHLLKLMLRYKVSPGELDRNFAD